MAEESFAVTQDRFLTKFLQKYVKNCQPRRSIFAKKKLVIKFFSAQTQALAENYLGLEKVEFRFNYYSVVPFSNTCDMETLFHLSQLLANLANLIIQNI